ncbi:DUF4244 domain-containing protein [Arthrobacter bambusae]|uniref:DUF4244 domain-containing protein n=1 Tax=Arthrobacter bambusae TaxID=1338426 RepID=UPI0027887856|nr:DUF4244 domain-containing protein [Arthrobacter bambusae]MDQ0031132.1 hypothetical protein [Arthrobacter bambusae]MDQ0099367.1 hypothetical protein [Arthrobacter bambusae]
MKATADTVQTALALAQAAPPRLEAEIRELFPVPPGSKAVRRATKLNSNAATSRAGSSDDSSSPKRSKKRLMGSELGMATAEYAIATLAAVGFAGLLVVILRSEEVRGFLLNLIRSALSLP